ncbi:MAG: hypothetical protein IJN04_06005 [Clostridia bacterium]|nr:hypothetical protein [Clostridia bacterium]MBQ7089176.1 hypothetical protein [Clostridia bacterium]
MKRARKLLAFVLAMVMLWVLTACGVGDSSDGKKEKSRENTTTTTKVADNSENSNDTDTDEVEHTGKKIEGPFCGASVFSEGLAFVAVDKNKTYCINKEGYIVFELDMRLYGIHGEIDEVFHNGVAILNNGAYVCDKMGRLTSAEDLGVTTFYDDALAGGYILADKITASFDSTKKEVGVLNTSLEWVVEPNEELYNQIGEHLTWAMNRTHYYYNDYLCIREMFEDASVGYLNLKTGEFVTEAPFEIPSHGWVVYTDETYRIGQETIVLDMSHHTNVSEIHPFDKGLACVEFHNSDANTYYFTMINEKGEFLFEPVALDIQESVKTVNYDGKDTVLITLGSLSDQMALCYNLKGELLGKKQIEDSFDSYYFYYAEDVVMWIDSHGMVGSDIVFLNTDFTPCW